MGEGRIGADAGDCLTGPRVSVVTPSFNHAAFLPERLASIRAQTYEDFEWIIIDDASTDESGEILRAAAAEDNRIRLVINVQNEGVGATTASAIALASGDYVYRAESDDVCAPTLLGVLVGLLDEHPAAAIAFSKTVEIRDRFQWYGDWPLSGDGFMDAHRFLQMLSEGNFVPGPTTMCRRQALLDVGGFGSSVCRVACDWDTWLRLALDHGAAWTSAVLGGHRWHGQNASSESLELLEERYRIVNDVFSRLPSDNSLQQTAAASRRSISYRAGAGAVVRARAKADGAAAARVNELIDREDPRARRRPGWARACVRAAVGARTETLRRSRTADRLPWEGERA